MGITNRTNHKSLKTKILKRPNEFILVETCSNFKSLIQQDSSSIGKCLICQPEVSGNIIVYTEFLIQYRLVKVLHPFVNNQWLLLADK